MQKTYPSPSRHYHRPPAPKSRRAWLWVLILIPLAIVGSVGFVLSLGVLFNMTGEELELSEPERELVLDIGHLSTWLGEYSPDVGAETVTKTRYIDDSYEIEYVYDVPEDDDAPYLTYTIAFEKNASDATTTYHSYWGGTKVAFFVFGDVEVSIDEKNELFAWGDESRFGVLLADGVPFGNVFIAKKTDTVVYLLVAGIYFDDVETVSELLTPALQKLDQYVPES